MMNRVRRIETRDTAGELGALLLESRLIKELKPMFNVAQRQRRRIVIAERRLTPAGYTAVHLRSVDNVDPRKSGDILGVFKHTTQAKEFLKTAVKERRLCPVLLGLEQGRRVSGIGYRGSGVGEQVSGANDSNSGGRSSSVSHPGSLLHPPSSASLRPCFSYHLGRCSGACIGEEPSKDYNARVEAAFEERRIIAWPYDGGLVIREKAKGRHEELFLVDNWVLVGSLTREGDRLAPFVAGTHRFDYDTYKIIYSALSSPGSRLQLRTPPATEWRRLLRSAE